MHEKKSTFKPINVKKHYSLYVLKLEAGKYYIGVTAKTVNERFIEHKNGFYGSEWTRIYKPISIEQSKDLGLCTYFRAEEYENKVTREYIKHYGLNNVRGGNIIYRGTMVKKFGYLWKLEDWRDNIAYLTAFLWVFLSTLYIVIDLIFNHHGRIWG